MCGRYVSPDEAAIERHFQLGRLRNPFAGLKARYNVAPQQGNPKFYIPAIRSGADGQLEGVMLQWWLLPHWSKEPRVKFTSFNARVETVATTAAFKIPFRRQRCLIPALGWYEWQELRTGKLPWYLHAANDELLAFAGLWDRWEGRGQVIESCSIVVGDASGALRSIHDRMPFVIPREHQRAWLDRALTDADKVLALLEPAPDTAIKFHRVSKLVNKATNEGPELLEAAA